VAILGDRDRYAQLLLEIGERGGSVHGRLRHHALTSWRPHPSPSAYRFTPAEHKTFSRGVSRPRGPPRRMRNTADIAAGAVDLNRRSCPNRSHEVAHSVATRARNSDHYSPNGHLRHRRCPPREPTRFSPCEAASPRSLRTPQRPMVD